MIKNYEEALEFLRKDKSGELFTSGVKSEELVKKAEEILSLKFSPMYKKFIREFGSISYGGVEIYGVFDDDFENSGVPDGIWYTLDLRRTCNLPKNLLVIYDLGNGEIYCQDYNKVDESEPKIVVYVPGFDNQDQTYEVIADNFGDFLVRQLNLEI